MRSFLAAIVLMALSCANTSLNKSLESNQTTKEFNAYWFSGDAEINRYELNQSRYGEVRQGEAVMVFVSEDFLQDKQLKYEYGSRAEVVSVLKLNMTRKFYTGLYPYSIMNSVFSPIETKPAIKASSSVQEWCGHTYSQLNYDNKHYRFTGHSYFQNEGDEVYRVDYALLEDEVWNLIRLNPTKLPQGNISIIPSLLASRLKHYPIKRMSASASLKNETNGQSIYSIYYDKSNKALEIIFETAFPHKILSWSETDKSGAITSATLQHTIKTDYWSKNSNGDRYMRDSLGLKTRYR